MKMPPNGYVVLKNVINKELLQIVSDYLVIQSKAGALSHDGIARFSKYGDPLTEALLTHCKPLAEQYSGKKLSPTYSYARIYRKGDLLKPHLDREACEYSLTIPIAYSARSIWSIYVMEGKKKIKIPLDIGDALLYKGCEVVHGRDQFTGSKWTQVFLHYVDAKGEHAAWKFDKRKGLGL